jgi:hypothetical protein
VFFVLFFFVLCTLCCQFLWIFLFRLPLRYSSTFIYHLRCKELKCICAGLFFFFIKCLYLCGHWRFEHPVATHIVLCFCFVYLHLLYLMLPVPLDCQILIAPSVFSNIYFLNIKLIMQKANQKYVLDTTICKQTQIA